MSAGNSTLTFPAPNHNHAVCINSALSEAESYCRNAGLRLTELRRKVLRLIWHSHRPVGAYELLEQLTPVDRRPAPPTVYRSLDFLLEHKLIHRIDSLNAFIGCSRPGHTHEAQFFICIHCGEAVELTDPKIERALSRDAERLGFDIQKQTVEIAGICPLCQKRAKQ